MKAEEYLKQHALKPEFVRSKLGWNWNDEAIFIPIYNQSGTKLYDKIRHLDYEEKKAADLKASKFTFDPPGSHPALYCIHLIAKREQIILSEGEPDCASLWQHGFASVTGTGGVQKFDPAMAQQLAGKEVFVCLDTDRAGQDQVMDTARTLVEAGVKTKIVDLPAEVKDVSEFLAKGGDFQALIDSALSVGQWWNNHKPEDYALLSGMELLKEEFPPNPWLVERIIPKEGFVFFFAAEASYKTYLMLDLAIALASGKNWLEQDTFRVEKPARILFIDKENPREMIQRRVKGLKMDPEVGKNIFWVKHPEKLQLVDGNGEISEFMQSLGRDVEENNIDLIIIDSFVDLMVGNENNAGDTQQFVDALKETFPNKAFATLHHENKPSQGVFRSDSQRTRGSTNINAQATTMFRLELLPKSKTELTIKQTKARDAQKLDKFLVEAQIEALEDGKTAVAGFTYVGVVKEDAEGKQEEAEKMIQDMFVDSPTLSRQDILEAASGAGIPQRTVERALKTMTENGMIDAIADPTNKRRKNYILMDYQRGQNNE